MWSGMPGRELTSRASSMRAASAAAAHHDDVIGAGGLAELLDDGVDDRIGRDGPGQPGQDPGERTRPRPGYARRAPRPRGGVHRAPRHRRRAGPRAATSRAASAAGRGRATSATMTTRRKATEKSHQDRRMRRSDGSAGRARRRGGLAHVGNKGWRSGAIPSTRVIWYRWLRPPLVLPASCTAGRAGPRRSARGGSVVAAAALDLVERPRRRRRSARSPVRPSAGNVATPMDAAIGTGPRCSPTNGWSRKASRMRSAARARLVGVGLGQDQGELVAAVAGGDVRRRAGSTG